MSAEPLRLRLLLERLTAADVNYILVGGLAVNAWGYLRATRDIDLVPDPALANLEKLDGVLRDLGGRVEVGGRQFAASAVETFLRTGDRTLVATDFGQVGVLQGLPQLPPSRLLTSERRRSSSAGSRSRSARSRISWR